MNFEDAHFLVRCLRYRFRTEKLQLKTLLSLDLRGGTAVDIGANKGIYSYWLARAVGPNGCVLAFEPQPEMADYIERRRVQFKWRNVKMFNVALSRRAGLAKLHRQQIGDGSASLSRGIGAAIEVELSTLDSLQIPDLKYIKCDVEGHELDVFHGAQLTLQRTRPVVQFEATPTEANALFEFFIAMDYAGIMFLGDRYLPYSNPDNIPHYKFGTGGHRDFLFFPKEAIGSTIPRALADKFPICLD